MMALLDIKELIDLPILASEHGHDVDNFIVYVHLLMVALFVGWFAYFIYALIRFRSSRSPKASYTGVTSHASSYIEGIVAVLEGVLLIGFAVPLWAKVVDELPDRNNSTVIRLVAEQFNWTARYPGADGMFGKQNPALVDTSNKFGYDPNDPAVKDDVSPAFRDVRAPVDKPVLIELSSMDVIHSLAVKQLRICQDAIPGLRIPVHFVPNRVGKYKITCAQLCGVGHYGMFGEFSVMSQADFDKWMLESSQAPAATTGFE